ncbi:related to protein-arginine deiminase type II [Rhynchosporium agropyri]|uniref:Related to protein-arginine deiminase type II n=1 Tax=Rhynchosporium agropyri TaxID=914238 RepID=A0A1E1KX52_9HELO|nr:related to protein-arginine deiminase type II [Rhynchosporium agropyri]
MAYSLVSTLLSSLLISQITSAAFTPDIRADTNRDGRVDVEGNTDVPGKSFWSLENGAIFLPNIGDSTQRCSNVDRNGLPLSNKELAACSDASGHYMLYPKYAAPIRTVPLKDISNNAFAYVKITPQAAYDRTRLFVHDFPTDSSKDAYRLVDAEFSFNATQLRQGLVLSIDGRELVTDSKLWDGKVLVEFEVHDGNTTAKDAVALKMAPVLTHHHLQKVERILTTQSNETDEFQSGFVKAMDDARIIAGVQTPLLLFNQSDDVWAQDFIEPGYSSMPGPNGPVSIRINLRSAQSTRTGGRQIFEQLRSEGMGGFQPSGGFGHREINSFGNLETIPPYTSKSGAKYPAGRIIMGKHFSELPAQTMLTFLNSQVLQAPLILETGWLVVGHVDEFVQFLPYDNELGFTIAIADTPGGLKVMRDAVAAGQGNGRAISFNKTVSPELAKSEELTATISDMLNRTDFLYANEFADKWITHNLEILLAEIPLDPKQVIRVPTTYKEANWGSGTAGDDGLPSHTSLALSGEIKTAGYHPSSINGVVIGHTYISPSTWGPIVDGRDLLAVAVEEAYSKANMTIHYVDDFLSHHVGYGEVHCGSNSFRQTDQKWWV